MIISKEQLHKLLLDIATRVANGDSFEGSISYSCMDERIPPEQIGSFEVQANFRIGNSEGQGGTIMIQPLGPMQQS